MRLKIDRAAHKDWPAVIEVVFKDLVLDNRFAIQCDGYVLADHANVRPVPLADGRIGNLFREAFMRGIVPQSSGALFGSAIELCLVRVVPNLHLGDAAKIDTTVTERA